MLWVGCSVFNEYNIKRVMTILTKIKKHPFIIILIFDLLLIVLASYCSFLLKFDGKIPSGRGDNFFVFTVLAVLVTPLIFYFFGLYKISWSFVSLTNIPTIGKGVVVSTLFLGTALYIFRFYPFFEGFPRSIIIIYCLILFIFTSALRFSKRIYWQLIRGKAGLLKAKDELILPLTSKTLNAKCPKKILVTGGAGYIGSVLVRQLLKEGYFVKAIDKLLFGDSSIKELKSSPSFQFIQGDILNSQLLNQALINVDAVVHLAAIVGEPACLVKKDEALKLNYLGTIYLARLCKTLGIKRFIYASTCSSYGKQKNNLVVKEEDSLFPVDFYGETKIYAERELMKLMDANFSPTILRFSTVYGFSPRMRFDLVVNTFTKKAIKEKEILIFGGDQWRPLVHVNDVARAICLALEAPLAKTGNQVFNLGGNSENYLISQVGKLVKECIPQVNLKTVKNINDQRSYRVDFTKIQKILNFNTEKTVRDGIIEIREKINNGYFGDIENKKYYNHLA